MIEVLVIAGGAAVGASLRYLTDRMIARFDPVFPWATAAVNVTGSFILGLSFGLNMNGWSQTLLGVGFCGALTTYSTFSYETLRLAESGAKWIALVNVVTSVLAGLGAAALGYVLATALGGR